MSLDGPRFAVTFSIKNEARLLPSAIEVYRALGCSKFYIFFDGTTDDSREVVASQKDVSASESVPIDNLRNPPAWVNQIAPRWMENMDIRKRINTLVAAREACRERIDWLICVDPDEVVLPSLDKHATAADMKRFLGRIPDDINQLLVRNYEVAPRTANVRNPFSECTLFYNRFPATDQLWRYSKNLLRIAVQQPQARAWFDYLFYSTRFLGSYPKAYRHPRTGATIPRGYYLGYSNHKSIIRPQAGLEMEFNIHKWEPTIKNRAKTRFAGALLHYDIFDVDALIEKFSQRTSLFRFNGDYHRNEMARIATEEPKNTVQKFFEENLMVASLSEENKLIQSGIARRVSSVASLLKS